MFARERRDRKVQRDDEGYLTLAVADERHVRAPSSRVVATPRSLDHLNNEMI
jgi:hypothetical protein